MVHIRSLVGFDNGEYETPKFALLNLLNQATGNNRDRNKRDLLWIRIRLADVMREYGEADDALMLFSELVEPLLDELTRLKESRSPQQCFQLPSRH